MKEAKRIDTTTADCRCHQITIPRHRDLSKKDTHTKSTTTISNFRIECHLFRNAKSVENRI
jgi:hypothetical protein